MNNCIKSPIKLRAAKVALLSLLMLLCSTAFAAKLSSTVDRNSMSINETLTLKVTLDEQVDSQALDLSGLRSDFEILGVTPRNSTSISTINGKTTRVATTQWTITLSAKREGNLTIPVFSIKQATSNPISIKALNDGNFSSSTKTQTAPLLATGLAQKGTIYPGQQLIYQVELSAAANVTDLNGATLNIPGASVELIDQQQFQRIDNGVARTIVVLKYVILAQESGTLRIPPLTFTGLIGGRRSLFGNQGQQVVGRTKTLPIEVKAKPELSDTPWFPAESVTINATWSVDKNDIKTGEPVTRTITVTALGQLANAIPPLSQPDISSSSVKFYKDKAQLNSQKNTNGYISTRVESEAIVVNSAGDIEMPAVSIDWFNVNSNRWEKTTLAAETLKVSGKTISNSMPIATPSRHIEAVQDWPSKTHWAWPLATAVLTLVCLLQFILLITRQPAPSSKEDVNANKESETRLWKSLLLNFKGNDSNKIRSSIIAWARAAHPELNVTSLETVFSEPSSPLTLSIKKLEASLYEHNSELQLSDFKVELKRQIEEYRSKLGTKNAGTVNDLPPLYSH